MLRNKEVRLLVGVCSLIGGIGLVLGMLIAPTAALLILALCLALGIAFAVFTRARYRRIETLSDAIDQVLHNVDTLYISDAEEGELAILQSEIAKMTLRLQEQNNALRREKTHLADAMADIAHQLRTPLTSLNLTLTLLKKPQSDRERRALLYETSELLDQMDWQVNTLLKLSRLDAGMVTFNKEDVPVRMLVDTALRPFAISIDLHAIAVETNIPQDACIQGDLAWLVEAVQNIVKNCIENAGDDGCVTITCEDNLLYTELTLHDSGSGFDRETLAHVFDRFYRGKGQNASGYGIGLALCRTIVMGQGGTVSAKNHPKGGAVFALRFPK